MTTTTTPPEAFPVGQREPTRSLRPFWVGAAILVVLDGFVLNQGLLAAFVGLWAFFSLLMLFLREKGGAVALSRSPSAILLGAALLTLLSLWANNHLAANRAGDLIQAVQQYSDKHGHYPASLDELVPGFIVAIPTAKYSIFFNSFTYMTRTDEAYLSYVNMPPFGMPTYLFSSKQWVR